MATSVDSSVARFTGNVGNTGSIVSASFTPADNSLIELHVSLDESPGPNGVTVSGGGLTWTERVSRGQADATEGLSAIFTAPVLTGASMTITVARNGGDVGNRRLSAKPLIWTGQHASPIGFNAEADWTSDPQTLNGTATGQGRMSGNGTDWNATGTPEAVTGQTQDTAHHANVISIVTAWKDAEHSSGTQGITFNPAAAPAGNVVVLEILAAGAAPTSLPPSSWRRNRQMVARF